MLFSQVRVVRNITLGGHSRAALYSDLKIFHYNKEIN